MKSYLINKKHEGRSLGNFLKKELRLPMPLIHKLLRKNQLKLNQKKPDLNWKLKENFELKIYSNLSEKRPGSITIPVQFYQKHLNIIFENPDFLILHKNPHIAVQPTLKIPLEKTLIGILEKYGASKNFSPRLVHRLDKDTSGVMIISKNKTSYRQFYDQFKERRMKKTYLALVKGRIPANRIIKTPVRDNKNQLQDAETSYEIIKNFSDYSLLKLFPLTGRFHQIRQHCADIGHPIVHDERYGDFPFNKEFQKKFGLKRQFLHADGIEFFLHGKKYHFQAPISPDLQNVLLKLEKFSKK